MKKQHLILLCFLLISSLFFTQNSFAQFVPNGASNITNNNANGEVVIGNNSNLSFASGSQMLIGPDRYAFRYQTGGGALTNYGMFFSNTASQYQLLNGSGSPLFYVHAGTGDTYVSGKLGVNTTSPYVDFEVADAVAHFGIVGSYSEFDETGQFRLFGDADYLVPSNKYAFRYVNGNGGKTNFGLYFNAVNNAYEFLDGSASTLFSVGTLTGDGYFNGNLGVNGLSGTGTRMVVADDSGKLSTQAIPTGGSSLWSENGTDIYRTGGNVGIGTTSPSVKLEVQGNLQVNAGFGSFRLYHEQGEAGWSFSTTGGGSTLLFRSQTVDGTNTRLQIAEDGTTTINNLSGAGDRMVVANGVGTLSTQEIPVGSQWQTSDTEIYRIGNVGFGEDEPNANIHITSFDFLVGVEEEPAFLIQESVFAFPTSIISDRFSISKGGYVNIGAGTAEAPLHIKTGSDATLASGGAMVIGETTAANIALDANEIMARNNGAISSLYLQPEGGNVGIGQTGVLDASLYIDSPVDVDPLRVRTDGDTRLMVHSNGSVSIGGTNEGPADGLYVRTAVNIGLSAGATGYDLAVDGKAICEELTVKLSGAWPDYVFEEDYDLMPLEELEENLKQNKHLPNIPSAKTVAAEGLHVGEMQKNIVKQVEEMTLHLIEQNKTLKQQKDLLQQQNDMLQKMQLQNELLQKRIEELESK